jgi:predicted Ser/Thr protein kinase
MTVADPHLADLSDDERGVLEAWLVDFDRSWGGRGLRFWVRKLPPAGERLRRAALVEMVKIDLEHRWQRGRPTRLEAYVKAVPELGPPACLPADLILAEYEARRESGAPADLAEFAKRFPRQAEELRRLVERGEPSPSEPHPPHARGPSIPPDARTPLPGGPAPDAELLPAQFGRYRILRNLGEGAMGAVYLAHDSQLDRRVALKAPRFAADDCPEVRQRFFREARAAAAIEHPNICPVYDVGEVNGAPYLAMAYVQGQSLAQLLQGPVAMPPRRAADLVRTLALALQEAHDRGVIHRDLKPSNVLINQRGQPVLVDFGLARRLRPGDVRLTQLGQPVGTPAYMSPEQAVGAGPVGPGCDVYSLGVILYQLLTGRLPFEGSMAEVLGQIVSRRPDPPSAHRPDLDPRLDSVCLKALSKEVADRYASMRDFAARLADYLAVGRPAGTPAPRGPAAPSRVVGRGFRGPIAWFFRKPLRLVVVAGAAAVAALLAVVLWTSSPKGAVQGDTGALQPVPKAEAPDPDRGRRTRRPREDDGADDDHRKAHRPPDDDGRDDDR